MMRFIIIGLVIIFISSLIQRAVRRGVVDATKVNDADLERSIRRGQGEEEQETNNFVIGLGVILWSSVAALVAWVAWDMLNNWH